jgi:hypothetical protein
MSDVVVKKRGRQPGTVKQSSRIEDPILGDYFIDVTKSSFDVSKKGSIQPLGYYTSLNNALKAIAKEYIPEMDKKMTIKQYIAENQKILDKMLSFFD